MKNPPRRKSDDLALRADRADFIAWAASRQADYALERVAWRVDHPLGPVEVTEKAHE